jgi:COP9 signalosome complex subunit 6
MENPLLSTQKSTDSGLQAALHPLVLLTISDYITRHSLRGLQGPVVGALLGQQNGREITIEHAFECATVARDGHVALEPAWFATRLDQSKTTPNEPHGPASRLPSQC